MRRQPLHFVLAVLSFAACSDGNARFTVRESVEQLHVTHAEPGAMLGVFDATGAMTQSGTTDVMGSLMFRHVAPASGYFRRVRLFGYVDRLCPVSIEQGHVAPEGRLDLHARSDFGRVLDDLLRDHGEALGRGTLLLVLGDARNNRLPPRVDLWRAVRERVKTVVWLVPEPHARWDTGDSVLRLYAPGSAAVVECLDLATLVRAVRRALA